MAGGYLGGALKKPVGLQPGAGERLLNVLDQAGKPNPALPSGKTRPPVNPLENEVSPYGNAWGYKGKYSLPPVAANAPYQSADLVNRIGAVAPGPLGLVVGAANEGAQALGEYAQRKLIDDPEAELLRRAGSKPVQSGNARFSMDDGRFY